MALAAREKLWSTPPEVVEAALDLLDLTPADVLADLGCGAGGALFAAAKRGARAQGWEILPDRAAATRDAVAAAGLSDRITVHTGNALDADVPGAGVTAVFLYLIERGLARVMPLLQAAAAALPGGILRVVTVQYRIRGLAPARVARAYLSDRPEVMYLLHRYDITPAGAGAVGAGAAAGASAGASTGAAAGDDAVAEAAPAAGGAGAGDGSERVAGAASGATAVGAGES